MTCVLERRPEKWHRDFGQVVLLLRDKAMGKELKFSGLSLGPLCWSLFTSFSFFCTFDSRELKR